jgi:hypothetical protein
MTTLFLARTQPPQDDPRPPEQDPGALVDWTWVRERLGFALRAVRRRPSTAALCFLAVAALGPLSLWAMPRSHRAEAIVTAVRNPVVSTLAEPLLRRAYEAEDPAAAARETILRRDQLLGLIEETGLEEWTHRTRAPAVRLVDHLVERATRKPSTADERVVALAEWLEKAFVIEVPGAVPGAARDAPRDRVRIALEWPDPDMAKALVDGAARRFFEGRHSHEVALAGDALGVLEEQSRDLKRQIEPRVARIHQLEVEMLRGNPALSRTYRAPRGRVPEEQDLARLRATLDAKKLALVELEGFRDRRVEELRGELARQLADYSEQHPTVLRTRETLERLEAPSPSLAALRHEIAGLEQGVATASERAARLVDEEDPALEYERTELRLLLAQYANVRDRLSAARVEIETAGAGFARRYGFASPPRVPKGASRPNPVLPVAAGLLGGALFALFAAAALDVRSGKVLERWQVERTLGLTVVGESRA